MNDQATPQPAPQTTDQALVAAGLVDNPGLAPVQRDAASAEFFDGTARGDYLLRTCGDCGHVRAPEVPMCSDCLSESFTWTPAAKRGKVESWVVMHARPNPSGATPAPIVVATVELDEGPWVTTALVNCDPADVKPGNSVRIAFVRPVESESIPVFLLA